MSKRICIFAGSNPGGRPEYVEAARAVGRHLAERGLGMVYGGGGVGLMGAAADGALGAGGEVVGVIPQSLFRKEIAHRGLSELRVVSSMHERKALMAELSDGFIALPGGLGTFEELMEILTWAQLGAHDKPVGALDVAGYYAPLRALLEHGVEEGFVRPQHARLLHIAPSVDELLSAFEVYEPPSLARWITPEAT